MPYEKIEWRVIEKLPDGVRYRKFIDGKPTNGYKLIIGADPSIDEQVGASGDDCLYYENAGTPVFSTTSSFQIAGGSGVGLRKYGGGMRFQTVTIPQGATIGEAYLTLRCGFTTSGTVCRTRIRGEDVDDAAAFSTQANYLGRTRITAYVDWDNIPAWTVDTNYNSPDIKTVIQEIIDRKGWASGNDMVIFWDDHDDRSDENTGCQRYARSYNGSATYAPKIHIEYTSGAIELSLTDGFKAGDTLTKGMAATLSLTEGIKGGDSFSQLSTMSPTLSDGLKLGDSLLAAVTFWLSLTEGINLGDTLTRTMEAFPTLTDGIKLSEAFDVLNTADLSLTDEVKFGDTLAILYKIQFTLSDGITFSDTNLAELETGIIYLTLRDGLNLGDSPLAEMLANLELSDGTKLGDSPLVNILASLGITDGLTFGDTTLKLVKLLTLSDGVKFADTGQLSALMNVSISDGMKLGDVPMINYFFRVISLVVQLYNRNLTTKLRFKSGI